jgi:uncharacterized protein YciI
MPNLLDPIRKQVVLEATAERAFLAFTDEMSAWWPLRTHSVGEDQAVAVRMDGRVGGQIVEILRSGDQCVWGTVTLWDPPRRVAFSWHPGRDASEATEVEVQFKAGPDGTCVELEHRGWERTVDARARHDDYSQGWTPVLERYRAAANGAARYQVLFHRAGPRWQPGIDFRSQPGVEDHFHFMRRLHDAGVLVVGGPFLDATVDGIDAVGMVVVSFDSPATAQQWANDDEAVKAGLLNVTVRPWLIPMQRGVP